jgi:inorganic pyrophosphatase
MNLDRVSSGKNIPDEINVIIEIPTHSDPVKYEVDKETGAMFVDRFMSTAMHYPCNYGYVPHTLSKDGDPIELCKSYRDAITIDDMPPMLLEQIAHFFEHYKDLDEGKWVRIEGWGSLDEAKEEIMSSVEMYKDAPVKPNF